MPTVIVAAVEKNTVAVVTFNTIIVLFLKNMCGYIVRAFVVRDFCRGATDLSITCVLVGHLTQA